MSAVDDRIVNMEFQNSTFEKGVPATLNAIDKLKQALNFSSSQKSLGDMQNTANRFSLASLAQAPGRVGGAFVAMSTVAITAIANITNRAINAGLQIGKSLSVGPLIDGFHEYATNLNSIQTILANTQASGATLDDVNGALQQLNHYSDKTIYNFSEMARNIGTFTAAGVDLDTSVGAIKGIANLAALSGSNSQQASTAMYQLSQAIAAGQVHLQDWNSVVNAGMGGTVFQRALAETAEKMGTLSDSAVSISGKMKNVSINGNAFRQSLTPPPGGTSWLTSKVLTTTLEHFTGDLTDAQLAAQGFTKEQIKAIQATAKTAQEAATKVKTISQLIDVAKETAGSGWAKTWQLVFGDFGEARKSLTNASNAVNHMINNWSKARNHLLADWKKLGGRNVLIVGLKKAFADIGDVIAPIQKAFRDIFPPATGKTLFNLTVAFRQLMNRMALGEDTMDNLRRTFRGIFAAFDIGIQLVKGLFHGLSVLFGAVGTGQGHFLNFTGNIGDFLVKLDKAIKKGDVFAHFFEGLAKVLAIPLNILKAIGLLFGDIFSGIDTSGTTKSLGKVGDSLSPLEAVFKAIDGAWGRFVHRLSQAGSIFKPIVKAFSGLGDAIANGLSSTNFSGVLDVINTGLFGALTLLVKKFFDNGFKINIKSSTLQGLLSPFKELTGTLDAMQSKLRAQALLAIAGAIALITVSLVALSLIDSAKLTKALAAMGVAFAELLGAMAVLEKISKSSGFLKMPFIAGSLILFSTAILILTGAVKVLSTMKWSELLKGLVGVGVLIGALSVAVKPLSANSKGMVTTGAGLILVATAIRILVVAVREFGKMDLKTMGKGLLGVATTLGILAGAIRLMPRNMVGQAAALVLIAGSLKILASAVGDFAKMKWKDLGRGLAGIAGALVILAGAMRLMPKDMVLQAGALILVGLALQQIAKAVSDFGNTKTDVLVKGMIAIAGALVILAGGLYLMTGSLAGSAALLVAAGALAVLTPVLLTLGAMSWEAIVKGLTTLAGAFVIIGLAGLVLTPVAPTLLALGAALLGIGAGLALAGAGALAFASAFAIFAAAGAAGIAVIAGMIALIPKFLGQFAIGIVDFAKTLASHATEFAKAFGKLIVAILNEVIKMIPKFGKLLTTMIQTGLRVLRDNVPTLISTGIFLLESLLSGIGKNIGHIVDLVTQIITSFLDALGRNLPKIVDAGFKMIIKFMHGIADAIRANDGEMVKAGADIAWAIVQGLLNGLKNGVKWVVDAAKKLASSALHAAMHVLGIHSPSKEFEKLGKFVNQGFAKGLRSGSIDEVQAAFDELRSRLTDEISASRQTIKDETDKLKELQKKPKDETKKEHEKRMKEIAEAKKALADATLTEEIALKARHKLTIGLKKQREELKGLAKDYESVTSQLDDARKALEDAKKARDDEASSIASTYNQLPDITKDTNLEDYLSQVQDQTQKTNDYFNSLEQLRALGLSDEAFQQLAEKGPDAQAFVNQLLAGGPQAVAQINSAEDALQAAATHLGTVVSADLNAAGIQAAQGLVDGLASQQGALEAQMTAIAKAMVRAIKKALKIQSPSRVLAEVGRFTGQGFVEGINGSHKAVERASEELGNKSLSTIRMALKNVGTALQGDLDMNPTITPVLDLSELQKNAGQISEILGQTPVVAQVSYDQASALAAQPQPGSPTTTASDAAAAWNGPLIEQTINSPKALDPLEVWRRTKSVVSLAKEALNA